MERPLNVVKTGQNCKVFCCVNGCNSKGLRNRKLSFHLFPPNGSREVLIEKRDGRVETVDARLAWILALKIGKRISKHMKVCSLHFKKQDFLLPNLARKKRCLKKCAVPSCNLPSTMVEKHQNRCKPLVANRRVLNRAPQHVERSEQTLASTDKSLLETEVGNVRTPEDLEVAHILCTL